MLLKETKLNISILDSLMWIETLKYGKKFIINDQ